MARRKGYPSSNEDVHPAVERAFALITRDYQRNLSIKELAAAANLSPLQREWRPGRLLGVYRPLPAARSRLTFLITSKASAT